MKEGQAIMARVALVKAGLVAERLWADYMGGWYIYVPYTGTILRNLAETQEYIANLE